MTVDTVIDGETRRPLADLYPDTSADERAAARCWVDPVTDELVMSIGSLLIRDDSRTVLVDCGLGPDPVGRFRGGVFRSALRALGVSREEITDVVFTHLHLDHIGWAVQEGVPYFPNAIYRCDSRDWEHFVSDDYVIEPWELASSRPEHDAARVRLGPLAGRMEFWRADQEILPGITAVDAAGHT
ncbi:MAG: Beta-lactamase domain protein, partial [Nocardioidaceae bacterium]|nr:Beta-lactamase domain protein [Nocardioidaceae bacterium]